MEFINLLEKELGKKAIKKFKDIQPGDVVKTFSDNKALTDWVNYSPKTSIDKGVKEFIKWYKEFYFPN